MNPNTSQTAMRPYASQQSLYRDPPTDAQIDSGVVPLDSLPAAWWNYYLGSFTGNNNAALLAIEGIRTELLNLLTAAGIPPSAAADNQIAQAVQKIRSFVATTTVPGAVKSSGDIKSISVDSEGSVTVNGLNDWASESTVKGVIDAVETKVDNNTSSIGDLTTLATDAKASLVAAVNELAQNSQGKFQFFPDYANAGPWITAWTDSNGYTATKNGWFAITYQLAETSFIHITVNGVTVVDFRGIVGRYSDWVPVTAGDVVNIQVAEYDPDSTPEYSQITLTAVLTVGITGTAAKMRFVPVRTVSEAPILHALSATYLRPAGSTSTRVTADEYGNLTAHEQVLKTATEFGDGLGDTYI